MISELKRWYDFGPESVPEDWMHGMEYMKNTFIRMMCDDSNETYLKDITVCLRQILIIEESLVELIPDRDNAN
ncbi:MAG: hypothetical protein Q8T08_23220 [Ignavibacteria bacterium]|nr:hypothetical protein [Ignavibacteria bacterium]